MITFGRSSATIDAYSPRSPGWNPHFHAIILEGGFDYDGTFLYIPFSGLQSMVEVFRRRVVKLLVDRELLNEDVARNLLS